MLIELANSSVAFSQWRDGRKYKEIELYHSPIPGLNGTIAMKLLLFFFFLTIRLETRPKLVFLIFMWSCCKMLHVKERVFYNYMTTHWEWESMWSASGIYQVRTILANVQLATPLSGLQCQYQQCGKYIGPAECSPVVVGTAHLTGCYTASNLSPGYLYYKAGAGSDNCHHLQPPVQVHLFIHVVSGVDKGLKEGKGD